MTDAPPLDPTNLLGEHFVVILLLWLFVAGYFFVWRFLVCSVLTWKQPNPLSAVLGFTALGWVVAILRDARWMSRLVATLMNNGALVMGVLAVIIICANEAARKHPWSRARDW